MSGVDDLVAWLRAQIDEDEQWALAASADRDSKTTVSGGVHWTWAVGDQWEAVEADPLEPYMGGYDGQWSNPVILRTVEEWPLNWGGPDNTLALKIAESEELRTADGAHIVRHDPARVLREVEAKRRILEEVVPEMDGMTDRIHGEWGVGKIDPTTYESLTLLRLLALPYADRPGYQESWRP